MSWRGELADNIEDFDADILKIQVAWCLLISARGHNQMSHGKNNLQRDVHIGDRDHRYCTIHVTHEIDAS